MMVIVHNQGTIEDISGIKTLYHKLKGCIQKKVIKQKVHLLCKRIKSIQRNSLHKASNLP